MPHTVTAALVTGRRFDADGMRATGLWTYSLPGALFVAAGLVGLASPLAVLPVSSAARPRRSGPVAAAEALMEWPGHGVAGAACVMSCACPATRTAPVRGVVPVLAATE
jgi:hypothetical protein